MSKITKEERCGGNELRHRSGEGLILAGMTGAERDELSARAGGKGGRAGKDVASCGVRRTAPGGLSFLPPRASRVVVEVLQHTAIAAGSPHRTIRVSGDDVSIADRATVGGSAT